MKAWRIEAFGALSLADAPEPVPGPGEVVVAVRAASLNFRDVMVVQGTYDPRQRLPLVPCSDAVGLVVAVGPAVTRVSVGDRVCPTFTRTWLDGPLTDAHRRTALGGPVDGVLQERIVAPQDALVAAPAHLTDAEAACLPCAGVTAWRALVEGGVGPGSSVLVLGTGGVSLLALQLARALGARVAITSRSREKLARIAHLSPDLAVCTADDADWSRTVATWAGDGVDLVVEVGGGDTLDDSLRAVRTGGTIALIGVLGGGVATVRLARIFMRGIRVQGVFVGNRADFEALCAFLARHPVLRPTIDEIVPFHEADLAVRRLAEGSHVGKLVVRFVAG